MPWGEQNVEERAVSLADALRIAREKPAKPVVDIDVLYATSEDEKAVLKAVSDSLKDGNMLLFMIPADVMMQDVKIAALADKKSGDITGSKMTLNTFGLLPRGSSIRVTDNDGLRGKDDGSIMEYPLKHRNPVRISLGFEVGQGELVAEPIRNTESATEAATGNATA